MTHLGAFTAQQISNAEHCLRHDDKLREEKGPGKSFLTKLLTMHSENPAKMTREDVFTACSSNIGAGSDTTSISLTSVIYNLMKSPSSYQKVGSVQVSPIAGCNNITDTERKPAPCRNPRSRHEGTPVFPLHHIPGVPEIAVSASLYQRGSPHAPGYGPATGPSRP